MLQFRSSGVPARPEAEARAVTCGELCGCQLLAQRQLPMPLPQPPADGRALRLRKPSRAARSLCSECEPRALRTGSDTEERSHRWCPTPIAVNPSPFG